MNREASSIPLTAIVLTRDEAINIGPCLEAMARVEDIVVVDSGSTDTTLELAQKLRPDARIFHHQFKDFGDQRNWALDNCEPRHGWVLFVDADEFCEPELLDEIEAFLREPGAFVGGYVAGRNYFLGRWLKYSTMYPSYQLRLLKLGHVRYRKEGHGQREVTEGPLHYFRYGWRHEGFSKGVSQWIARHNRYSTEEVELILRLRAEKLMFRDLVNVDPIVRRRAFKRLGARLPFRPINRFLYTYVLKKGFLDGYPGLLYCLLRIAHDIHIISKLAEQRRAGRLGKRDAA
ncbi:MAG: glycosyltransferase family 2 protein [Desulfobulbaceae bacterium]